MARKRPGRMRAKDYRSDRRRPNGREDNLDGLRAELGLIEGGKADAEKSRFAEREAERERGVGVSDDDASAKWLKNNTRYFGPEASWRGKPATVRQVAILREMGLPVLLYPTRGQAADAISRGKRRRSA